MNVGETILAHKGYKVYSIHPEELVSDVLRILNERRIGALMVLDANQNIEGIVSERDVLYKLYTSRDQALDERVKDIITPKEELIIGHEDDTLQYVMGIMTNNRIRHLPILNEEGKLEGLISIGDVIKAHLEEVEHENKFLVDYIQGKYPG